MSVLYTVQYAKELLASFIPVAHSILDHLDQKLAKRFVESLYQAICLWVVDGRCSSIDVEFTHQLVNCLIFKRSPIVQLGTPYLYIMFCQTKWDTSPMTSLAATASTHLEK